MVIQVVDSFSNEPQKVVPLITTSLAGDCDVENNKSCAETSGRNNETVAGGSSKGGSPSTGDETDLSDSGEESASVSANKGNSLSPDNLLNVDAGPSFLNKVGLGASSARSCGSNSSFVSSSSTTFSSTNMVNQLHLYCTNSPTRSAAINGGGTSEGLVLLSPPLPFEEAAEAEIPRAINSSERVHQSSAASPFESNRHQSSNGIKTTTVIRSNRSSASAESTAHPSPASCVLTKSPPSSSMSNRSSSVCSSASPSALTTVAAVMQSKRKSLSHFDESGNPIEGSSIEKRHKCEICGKGFPYLSILESHKRCHTGEKPFSCHFCDKKFAQKATLQVHERTHTGEKPYKCKYCDKTFAQYGTKTVHEKSAHLGIRNYKCPKCNKCLSSPSALYTHKKTHGDKSFQCNFCPKTFTLKNYLKLHIKQVHEHNERKHVCKFCSKTFAYAGSLQVHVRTHTGERPYMCKFCPKAFASQGNLQSHERTHTGERPYTCEQCGRSFIQKSQLTAHEATHSYSHSTVPHHHHQHHQHQQAAIATTVMQMHEQSNENGTAERVDFPVQRNEDPNCTQQQSISQALLTAVTNANAGYRNARPQPQNEFVCKFCGKRYAYASSLYVHTRLHTGERPFRCNFCDKSFTNQGNMQVHQRVHTGEKPYKCDACGKSYAQKVGLKIHQEQCQVHGNRRGSVMTVGTNESESSPSMTGEEGSDGFGDIGGLHMEGHANGMIVMDDEKNLTCNENLTNFLNGALKSHNHATVHSPSSQSSSLFSSPTHSQRNSISESVLTNGYTASLLEANRGHQPSQLADSHVQHHQQQPTYQQNLNVFGLRLPTANGVAAGQLTSTSNSQFGNTNGTPRLLMDSNGGTNGFLQSPTANGFLGQSAPSALSDLTLALAAALASQPTTPTALSNSGTHFTSMTPNGHALASQAGNTNSLLQHHPEPQSNTLAALLFEQLNNHNQQLAALKALMDFSSAIPSNSPPATSSGLVQPTPIYPSQNSQSAYQIPSTPQANNPYPLLNSQIHQQLLQQLIYATPHTQQGPLGSPQLAPFSGTATLSQTGAGGGVGANLHRNLPPSSPSAQQLAAATALQEFAKQTPAQPTMGHSHQLPSH